MILIIGGGFLGSYIAKHICAVSDGSVSVTVRSEERKKRLSCGACFICDVTSAEDLQVLKERLSNIPVEVFYLAASHNVDFVYENASQAKRVNIDALKAFLDCGLNIKRLIFASTDCVYGEDRGAKLSENSEPCPVNEYGRQKLAAEKIVVDRGFTCARLPFMLGPSNIEKPHFYDSITDKLKKGQAVEMIDGMVRSVLSFDHIAELLYALMKLESELPPIINVCGDKAYSKYDVGCVLAENIKVSLDLIKKISEEEGKSFFKDKRATSSVMDNTLLKTLLNMKKIEWREDIC